jgi:glycosyltransferase involved in cell wall biosynthesis
MAPYLEDTITSVLSNLRAEDEYFIVDGGSTDGSVDIIRRYENRITGWVSEPDDGYADAIGKGFERATGDILCWMNAGDLYLTGAFDAARSLLSDNVDMIFGDDFYIGGDNRILSHSCGWVPSLRAATVFGGWTPLQDACFWRRSLYEQIEGIDRTLKYAADYDLFLRMSLAGRSSYVPVTFSAFRRHEGQKSISGAASYKLERRAARVREMARYPGAQSLKLFRRIVYRGAMTVRARTAPLIWRQRHLAGRLVTDLSCASYR